MIDTKLKDKVAIVTGGNNPFGIGAVTAKALSAEGVKVFITYLAESPEVYGISLRDAENATDFSDEFGRYQVYQDAEKVLSSIRSSGRIAEAKEFDLSETGKQHIDHYQVALIALAPVNGRTI